MSSAPATAQETFTRQYQTMGKQGDTLAHMYVKYRGRGRDRRSRAPSTECQMTTHPTKMIRRARNQNKSAIELQTYQEKKPQRKSADLNGKLVHHCGLGGSPLDGELSTLLGSVLIFILNYARQAEVTDLELSKSFARNGSRDTPTHQTLTLQMLFSPTRTLRAARSAVL